MNKVLILKDDSTNFEKYSSEYFRSMGTYTFNPYNSKKTKYSLLWKAVKKININYFTKFFVSDEIQEIAKYELVIIFDNCLSKPLLKYVCSMIGKSNIHAWLWNVELDNINWIKKYSDVYCFDNKYAKEKKIHYAPQFYFAECPEEQTISVNQNVFFIGTNKGRENTLELLGEKFKELNQSFEFLVCSKANPNYKNLQYIETPLNYPEILNKIRDCTAILEVNKENQTGLTLRCMEALFYQKKLITNNKSIRFEKFYNCSNIFIIDYDDWKSFNAFITSDYIPIEKEIIQEYSFSNWLNCISK